MKSVEKILFKYSSIIEKEINSGFPGNIKNLHDAANYHMSTGGKRVRPVLAIATCEALGGDAGKILPFSIACEIFHNSCLVHDDLMDGDKIRRNKTAVWVKYGMAHSVNIGNYMLEKVYEFILKSKSLGVGNETVFRLLEAMNKTAIKTSEGQTMDINFRNYIPSEEEYMKMVTLKTGYYLTVPMVGGAIVAGADKKTIERLWEFGMFAGPAFQIADDILDMTTGKGRGEAGRDIKEGKKSILVIHCIEKCRSVEKKKILGILKKQPEKTTERDVNYAKSLFEKYSSIEYAEEKSEKLIKEAKGAIKGFPEKLKLLLEEFADYLVERDR
jgi:geranylgeranyl diphosphate synthase, type I